MDEGYYNNRYAQHQQHHHHHHQYQQHNNNNHDSYHNSRPQQPRHTSHNKRPNQSRNWKNPRIPYLNTQNFGILVAIFVIYFFQKQDGFGRLLEARRERGLTNAIMDMILEAHDYIVGFSQMMMEIFRNLRSHLVSNNDDWLHDVAMPPNENGYRTNGLRGRRGRHGIMGAPVASRIANIQMPELEETDSRKRQQQVEEEDVLGLLGPSSSSAKHDDSVDKENRLPLEPAFLNDVDYPPGWLVFDPVLGVISKAEADKYKRELTVKREQQQQQQNRKTQSSTMPAKFPMRQQPQHQPLQQQQQQQQQGLKQHATMTQPAAKPSNPTAATRPLRPSTVMPNASAMHFSPNSIAANG